MLAVFHWSPQKRCVMLARASPFGLLTDERLARGPLAYRSGHPYQTVWPGLGAWRSGASSRGVRGWRFEAFGGIEARREEAVGSGEGEHLAQYPEVVGDVAARQAGWRRLLVGDRGEGANRDANLADRVAVGAG